MVHARALALAVALVVGCSGDEKSPNKPDDTASETDATDDDPSNLADACRGDAPPRPFDDGKNRLTFGGLAGDFTVRTLDGRWNLSEQWTGCDSYVFINWFPGGEGDALFASNPFLLLIDAPRNAHFFFVSEEADEADRKTRVTALRDRLDLEGPDAARVHFVTDRLSEIDGSVGEFVSDYLAYQPNSAVDLGSRGLAYAPSPAFLGIDREQKWDSGGYTNDYVGGRPQLQMAAYLPHFYNHKAELAHRLDTEKNVTEVVLVDKKVTERVFVVPADLPQNLASFDGVEFDVSVFCPDRNVFGCSEWDRIARIEVCLDGETCTDRREIVRWITPYWRRGERRWAIDASPLKALLTGVTHLRIEMGPSWERATERHTRMSLRLSKRNDTPATGAERVYTGGTFDANYDTNHPPVTFTPPAGASKVELVLLLSGHGQDSSTNCAEWCDHRHSFSVNSVALPTVASDPGIGSGLGCAEAARDGVPPGQYGNWAPQRAYWCPGLPVKPIRLDLTGHVTPGQANTLSYTATRGSSSPPGGGNIDLSAYVVWY